MTEGVERDDWTIAELLEAYGEAAASELHTALPARVESYDASAQVADVTPVLRRTLTTEDGSAVTEALPTLRRVRVVHPRAHGGGWHLHMPLTAGDFVLLVVLERDPTRWIATGEVSPTPDTRLHHLAHAVAIPGLYPHADRLTDPPTDALVVGREGGARLVLKSDGSVVLYGDGIKLGSDTAAEALALASKVADELAAIAATLLTGTSATGGAVTFGTAYTPDADGVGSALVQVDE